MDESNCFNYFLYLKTLKTDLEGQARTQLPVGHEGPGPTSPWHVTPTPPQCQVCGCAQGGWSDEILNLR